MAKDIERRICASSPQLWIFRRYWCHLSSNISENKHATKKLTIGITINTKVLMDKQK